MQQDIQLTHEVLEKEALKLLQDKLKCNRVHKHGNTVVSDYIITAYQFFQASGNATKLAYQVASRSTIKSDAGPKAPHTSSFYAIAAVEGDELSNEKLTEIRSGLEALVAKP